MANKILYISACVRKDSRTEQLSRELLNALNGEISEINLYSQKISPVDSDMLKKRDLHDYSGEEFKIAKQFKEADTIVIAAPLWDLSFPAVLKIYLENITVSGITFEYSKEGRPIGKCKATKLYYITTSGGYIGNCNFGFDYVKALAENFFGIKDVFFFSAQGLDIFGADTLAIMDKAKQDMLSKIALEKEGRI